MRGSDAPSFWIALAVALTFVGVLAAAWSNGPVVLMAIPATIRAVREASRCRDKRDDRRREETRRNTMWSGR